MTDQLSTKYNIGDIVYVYNLFAPLIAEFKVNGVLKNEDEIYYTTDIKSWIREEYLHQSIIEAYEKLLSQAAKEAESLRSIKTNIASEVEYINESSFANEIIENV